MAGKIDQSNYRYTAYSYLELCWIVLCCLAEPIEDIEAAHVSSTQAIMHVVELIRTWSATFGILDFLLAANM